MKFTRLRLKDYRGLPALEIEPASSLTLIVARNGVGKTSVVAGLAAAIAGLVRNAKADGPRSTNGLVNEMDHRRQWPAQPVNPPAVIDALAIEAEAQWGNESNLSWTIVSRRRYEDNRPINYVRFKFERGGETLGARLAAAADGAEPLPLLASLPARRARRPKAWRDMPRLSATESVAPERLLRWSASPVLETNWLALRDRWFELELRSRVEGERAKFAIRAITQAIKRALRIDQDPKFNADVQDFLVNLRDDGWRSVGLMSDGWHAYVSTVVAVAMRCAELNPTEMDRDAAEVTPGVLLIDEIEQHLHPLLQRDIVDGLRRAFPKLQIIATTHSALVITDIKDDPTHCVLRLERHSDGDIHAERLLAPVGFNATQILTGAWFGLASTLDDDTLNLMAAHRALMRQYPAEPAARADLEERLRGRLHRYAETSVEEFVLSVVAELETDPAFEALSNAEMKDLRRRVLARIKGESL